MIAITDLTYPDTANPVLLLYEVLYIGIAIALLLAASRVKSEWVKASLAAFGLAACTGAGAPVDDGASEQDARISGAIFTTGPTITNDHPGRIAATLSSRSMSKRSSITP